ncbi:MAG: NUDIX hydrolase [Firmicutes bacterium]|nr:NUDIX hydrolase [Bacillota bacterium]
MKLGEDTLRISTIYEGRIFRVEQAIVSLPDGNQAYRDVVKHPGAVAVLAWPSPDSIILVRQFRYATGEELWEIPAGKLEPGEDPASCAARELSEEAGFRPQLLKHIYSFYTSPGFSSELLYLYEAKNLISSPSCTDDDEFLEVTAIPLQEAMCWLSQKRIKDAKTIIALLWACQQQMA